MFEDFDMVKAVGEAIRNCQRINKSKGLSEDDKRRLKDAYVRNYLEPEARRLLQQKIEARNRFNRTIRAPR
jgi:hypothetical protein